MAAVRKCESWQGSLSTRLTSCSSRLPVCDGVISANTSPFLPLLGLFCLSTKMSTWLSAFVEQESLVSGHSDTINHLSFSPDGTYLTSCGDDNSLIIWSIEESRLLYRLVFKSPVDCAIWHPLYPGTLIVGCDNGYLFQLQDFSPVRTYSITLC